MLWLIYQIMFIAITFQQSSLNKNKYLTRWWRKIKDKGKDILRIPRHLTTIEILTASNTYRNWFYKNLSSIDQKQNPNIQVCSGHQTLLLTLLEMLVPFQNTIQRNQNSFNDSTSSSSNREKNIKNNNQKKKQQLKGIISFRISRSLT